MKLDTFLEYLTMGVIVPLVVFTSIWLSRKTGWPQFTKFFLGIKSMLSGSEKGKKMSSFAAVATIIGGNLGTGTIVGTAVAISTGGPGAIAWMLVIALLCSVIKLFCASLGVLFHEDQKNGRKIGGPMFYIDKGLHLKVLAALYSMFLLGEAVCGGTLVQVNSFVSSFGKGFEHVWILICALMIPTAFILFGGLKRFASFMSCIVPVMGLFFIAACIIGIFNLRHNFLNAVKQILSCSVGINQAIGGGVGYAFVSAMNTGVRRALFAADIGFGLAGIAHSNVDVHTNEIKSHAKLQGVIALVAPMFVGMLCSVTGILILCAAPDLTLSGGEICTKAFNTAFNTEYAQHFVQVMIYCFAITTILAWAWFAEHTFFFFRKSWMCKYFKIFVIAMIPFGARMKTKLPWELTDICASGLIITNLTAIILLRKHVVKMMSDNSRSFQKEE